MRYTEAGDDKYLKEWLDGADRRWFPMVDEVEIDDAVMRWIAFYRYKCSLTVTKDGVPCGIATFYLQPYRSLPINVSLVLLLGRDYRGMGVGSYLLSSSCI